MDTNTDSKLPSFSDLYASVLQTDPSATRIALSDAGAQNTDPVFESNDTPAASSTITDPISIPIDPAVVSVANPGAFFSMGPLSTTPPLAGSSVGSTDFMSIPAVFGGQFGDESAGGIGLQSVHTGALLSEEIGREEITISNVFGHQPHSEMFGYGAMDHEFYGGDLQGVLPGMNARSAVGEIGPAKQEAPAAQMYACKYEGCGKTFTYLSILKVHTRVHTGDRPHKCHLCENAYTTSSRLKIHVRTHSNESPYVCEVPGCGKQFKSNSNLTQHSRVHMDKQQRAEFLALNRRTVPCKGCGNLYKTVKSMDQHYWREHVEKGKNGSGSGVDRESSVQSGEVEKEGEEEGGLE
ncbi:hypothetical protein HDU98_010125 [Podochytrium sp. JEL0797]|nr:hypothetical protein HDU98_010125 [Podochytrium sp. JEL0797]